MARRFAARAARGGAIAISATGALVGLPAPAAAQPGHLDRSPALQGDLAVAPPSLAAFSGPVRSGDGRRARVADAAPTWCGRPLRRDDTRDDVFRGAPTIKLVYAYPRGRPNRFRYFARLLQADVGVIDSFVAQQSGGRKTVRFDMGTSCGPQYADIQVLRLKGPARAYLSPDGDQLAPTVEPGTPLQREIASAARGQRHHNFLVYVDGLNHVLSGNPPSAWGMTDVTIEDDKAGRANGNNRPGRISAVFGPDNGVPPLRPAGFASMMLLHELLHSVGAVQDAAPHATGGGHCYDGADVMCYADGGPRSALFNTGFCAPLANAVGEVLDCSRDDYFNPSPTPGSWLANHWNTYDSLFLASCNDPNLRIPCAAATASAATLESQPTSSAQTVTRPIVRSADSSTVGTMTLSMTVDQRDVVATASSGALALPAGLYSVQTCLSIVAPGAPTWSNCWSRSAGAAEASALPESVTVTRPNTPGTIVQATVNVQDADNAGAAPTIASSDQGAQRASLAVPALASGPS